MNISLSELQSRYENGETCAQIASTLGVDGSTVNLWLKKAGVPRRSSGRLYLAREDFFDRVDTEVKAYLLGLLFADGCNHRSERSGTVSLDLLDRELVELARDALYPNRDMPIKVRERQGMVPVFCLRVGSYRLSDAPSNLGMVPRKSLVLEFPTQVPDALLVHFIRGYFDGDGCLTRSRDRNSNGFLRFSWRMLGTPQFLSKVQEVLTASVGVRSSIRRNRSVSELYVSGNRQVLRVTEWLYKNATVFLQRKRNTHQELKILQAGKRGGN